MVGGSEDMPGLPSMGDVSVGLGAKPKSRMKLDQGTEYTVGALKAMKSAVLQAMLTQAKSQGKKWSDLPASTPERVAYRQVNKAVKKVAGKPDEEAINLADLQVDEDSIIAATLRSIPKDKTPEEQRMMARKEIERLFGDIDIKSVVGGPTMEEAEELGELKMVDDPKNPGKKVPFYAADGKGKGDLTKEDQPDEKEERKADASTRKGKATVDTSKPKVAGGLPENWFKGNKDELLFETLTKKWTK